MIGINKRVIVMIASVTLSMSVIGCSSNGSLTALDQSSTLTLEQSPIVRKAPSSGQLSVFDLNQQRVVFSGYVKSGEVVTLDPVSRQLTIDKDIAADQLNGGDQFQLAFTAAQ